MKLIASPLFALLIIGCCPPKSALRKDASLASEEYKVKSKQGPFTKEWMKFGKYHTLVINRPWMKGKDTRFGMANGNVTHHHYTNPLLSTTLTKNQH